MKKVIIVSSSPRKGGNSEVLAQKFAEGVLRAVNVTEKGAILKTAFPEKTYEMGKNV